MVNYTQRQLAKEWNRRQKAQKINQLKQISIYKLKDGTYTDQSPNDLPDIKWFIIVAILLGVSYSMLG